MATRSKAKVGTEFAFIDTSKLMGHMFEIYVPDETLSGLYDVVNKRQWAGMEEIFFVTYSGPGNNST